MTRAIIILIHALDMKPPPSPTVVSPPTSRSSITKTPVPDLTSPHRMSRGPRPASSPLGPRTRGPRGPSSTAFSDTSSNRDSLLSFTAEAVPAYPGSPLFDSPPRSFASLSPIVESVSTEHPPLKPSTIVPPPVIRIIPKPATLVPAPQISFDSVPVDFKNLTLDAFLCKSSLVAVHPKLTILHRDPRQQRPTANGLPRHSPVRQRVFNTPRIARPPRPRHSRRDPTTERPQVRYSV